MNFATAILFMFAGLGVVNGAVLSTYLFLKRKRSLSDLFFGILLFALSIRIGKSVLVFFDPQLDKLILQVGLSACLFIGPSFYLFMKSQFRQEAVNVKQEIRLLWGLLLLIAIIGFIWPYRVYPELWNAYFVKGIYAIWLFYVGWGLYVGRDLFKKIGSKNELLSSREQYLLIIMLGIIFITLTYQFALYVRGFTYIWGSLIFSFSFYYLLWRALKQKIPIAPQTPKPEALENGQLLFEKLNQLMEEHKLYFNPRLKLEDLAQHSGIQRHILSRVLNEVYKNGFAQYVNEYRIREAQRLIRFRDDLSLEGIGYESGFNSKSSFYAAFKKISGSTPLQFKKQVQS